MDIRLATPNRTEHQNVEAMNMGISYLFYANIFSVGGLFSFKIHNENSTLHLI